MSKQNCPACFCADFELVETASGEPTIWHRPSNIFLHSRRDPWHEAGHIVSDWTREPIHSLVLWGLGLGYVAEALHRKLGERTSLWIIETHPELVALAKQVHPQWQIWQSGKVAVVATRSLKRLQDFLAQIPATAAIQICASSQALQRWEGGDLAGILESLTLPCKNSQAHASFVQAQGQANAPYLARCRYIGELFHKWRGEPVLVLGAGPSLTETLKHLVQMPQRPRLLASNGALPVLTKWGIRPDLALCIESRVSAKRDIERADYMGPLVIFPSVNHELLREFKGPLYLAFPQESNEATESALASGVGTVMAPALDLAAKMGGNPILLAGLDLAWEDTLYAGGVERATAAPQALLRAETISGHMTWTSAAFASFASGLARILDNLRNTHPNLRIFDLKTAGLRIPGAIPWRPEQLSKLISLQEIHSSPSLS
ncbi:MAG: 6-hydroxymethylpterin diphosphokinase MptE-like protein [bacterium]